MIDIIPADLFVMWTTSLLFVLWRTHSITSNLMLTSFVVSMFVISVLHRLFGEVGCLYLMMAVITVFVWIEVPKYTYHNRRSTDEK